MFNIMASVLLWVGVFAVVVHTWPRPPWNALLYASGAMMLVMPFLCYPFAKTVFLAFDLLFRPPGDTEVRP